jgi:hypothetical protein
MTLQTEKQPQATRVSHRVLTQVGSLDDLVGAHLLALRDIYGTGKPADPTELGDAPRGRLLALEQGTQAYMLTRGAMQLLARDWMPWQGKAFDHGGDSGANVVLGRRVARFRTEIAGSAIDGLSSFVLLYGEKELRNPWPVSALRGELRTVGDGIAIGLTTLAWRGQDVPLLWFGLERARG